MKESKIKVESMFAAIERIESLEGFGTLTALLLGESMCKVFSASVSRPFFTISGICCARKYTRSRKYCTATVKCLIPTGKHLW